MSERTDGTGDPNDEFERLGRQAGAELRTAAPTDGYHLAQRAAGRRRTTRTAVAAGVSAMLVVAGLVVIDRSRATDDRQDTVAPVPTVTTTPRDPGTWRTVPDAPQGLSMPLWAVWTGREAIVVGIDEAGDTAPSAVGYDVRADRWRELAEPPATAEGSSGAQWTGSEVLTATLGGQVFAYDPGEDQWTTRTAADESMGFKLNTLVAVSARGVLARTTAGWWWYDDDADAWESLTAPGLGADVTALGALDDQTMVAIRVGDATITSSVLDIASRTWEDGPEVAGIPDEREPAQCTTANALVVCTAEGYSSLEGTVIDPRAGSLGTFSLGSHSSSLRAEGTPWYAHEWKILLPRADPTWEDLPLLPGGASGFSAAVWTGSEIVFFGGTDTQGESTGQTAAYTPVAKPGTTR
ncbi:MAG: hypothetical protein ABIP36_09090 [Acidimicrobiales bacterium]